MKIHQKNKSIFFARKKLLKNFWIFFFFFSLGLTACDFTPRSKTLVYCSEGSPKIFNPQLASDGPSFEASGQALYNRLVSLNSKTLRPEPSLATSWEISSNGLKLSFNLRQDVVFHKTTYFSPTRNFNADDVIFSFERMRDKNHPYHKVNGGNYQYFQSLGWDRLIKKILKLNMYRVQFVLTKPSASFLDHLAGDAASILSKEYGDFLLKKKQPKKIDFEPIGTGPFILKSYLKDHSIRYLPHPHYFLGKTPVDSMVFSVTPDSSVRLQKLKTKECHIMRNPSPTDIASMKKMTSIKVLKENALNVGYLAFNVKKKPFDDIFVRKAIYHALNRKSYIKSIFLGYAVVAKNPLSPHMWAYHEGIKDYEYDIKKAKQFLKKSSQPKGFKAELLTLPIARPYNPSGKKMGELIQADLAKIGIEIHLMTYKWATYLDKVKRGEHQMAQFGWSSENGDPSGTLEVLLSCKAVAAGSNSAQWCNLEFDRLITAASQTLDLEKRKKLYKKAQEIFHKQIPWVPIAHSQIFTPIRKNVIHFVPSLIDLNSFYGVDLVNE